ncbi:MAG TPA: dethiobiotin synthase [Spirochaetota bacterium]|nr:dethiobiotin synthase [Spirochaetota bacterium]
MKRNLFITATNTGVGKTVVSSLICKTLIDSRKKTAYYKPIQTGGENGISPDCNFLDSLFKNNELFVSKSSYVLKKAASPHFAAKIEEVTIKKSVIKKDYEFLSKNNEFVITEGAGGLLVPINEEDFFIADIPKTLDLNVVLVSNAGLGAINNVCLNYFLCNKTNINISVLILIYYGDNPNDVELNNFETLKKITDIKNIYLLKAVKDIDTEKIISGNLLKSDFPEFKEIEGWFE